MEQRIVGFHQEGEGHWVAKLECGHGQHVRHVPPWQVRPWVTTAEGRTSVLGTHSGALDVLKSSRQAASHHCMQLTAAADERGC